MCLPIPLGDKLHDFGLHVLLGGKIGYLETLALKDAEPLFDLTHPRAMCGCEVKSKAQMSI